MRHLGPFLFFALFACADGESTDGADGGDPASDGGPDTDAVGPVGGDGGTQRGECPNREEQGRILTCAAIDRCEEVPLDFMLACCQCNTRYCRPDPACEPPPDPPDLFADDVLPRLDRLCRDCHGGTPNPDDSTLALHLSPALPPDALTPEQLEANRAEALSFATPADPAASPLAARPTGQAHVVVLTAGDADHAAIVEWIRGL